MMTPRILVLGDVMLDRYISGTVDRTSPEAPVPVVRVDEEWDSLGGAANVAANVHSLGAVPILIGLVGDDMNGKRLAQLCSDAEIESILLQSDSPTVCKTRVISGQQIVRFDRESQHCWTKETLSTLNSELVKFAGKVSLLIISDYAKGTLTKPVVTLLEQWASTNNVTTIVDPKRPDWSFYGKSYLITPNLKELSASVGYTVPNEDSEVISATQSALDQCAAEHILVTRAECGMTLVGRNLSSLQNIPAHSLEVFDVSGAGDTVLATLGVWLAEGHNLTEAVLAANTAASIAVGKRGAIAVTRSDFQKKHDLAMSKIVLRQRIPLLREQFKNKRVVFTNGCFDILHSGHKQLIASARALGDVLIIGLNADESIQKIKGPHRPINTTSARATALAAFKEVDAVVVFSENTPEELIKELQPDILVKGGDYKANEVVGKEFVKEVVIIPLVEGVSTTRLLDISTPDLNKRTLNQKT